MNRALDILIPRFVTEYVVLTEDEEHFYMLCPVHMVPDEEKGLYKKMVLVKAFNLFGKPIFVRLAGEVEDVRWEVN